MMVKPNKLPVFVRDLLVAAKRDGITSYRLSKDSGMSLSSAQLFLAGDLNPTASTVEAIATALGMRIKTEAK